jgi:hypothetical protein
MDKYVESWLTGPSERTKENYLENYLNGLVS